MPARAFPEWPDTLDMQDLHALGWRPVPFREFILKIQSRCDLACDYCYMYTLADQSWKHQPRRMSLQTIDCSVNRIAEHAAEHQLDRIRVILHGGEPLLAGAEMLAHIATQLRHAVSRPTMLSISMQTNGMHLTQTVLRLLARLDVQVGVSLDGSTADHDRHRRRPNGHGSHSEVARGLRRLSHSTYRHLFRGLLCTIDLNSDPIATYEALLEFDPPALDFLLPHGNWSNPPPGLIPGSAKTPYADWLIAAFDRWYGSPQQEASVRLFEQVIEALFTGRTDLEDLGLEPVRILVIETDGSIAQSDFLKSAYDGAAATGLHVRDDSLDVALLLPSIAARQLGSAALSAECGVCRIHRVCGAGQYAHRYRAGSGFLNPSVYCADLRRLITYIRDRVAADVARIRESW